MHREGQPPLAWRDWPAAEDQAAAANHILLAPYRCEATVYNEAMVLQALQEEGEIRLGAADLPQVARGCLVRVLQRVPVGSDGGAARAEQVSDALEGVARGLDGPRVVLRVQLHVVALAQRHLYAQDEGVPSDHAKAEHEHVHEDRAIFSPVQLHGRDLGHGLDADDLAHVEVVTHVLFLRPGGVGDVLQQEATARAQQAIQGVPSEFSESLGRPDDWHTHT
mmetsp:Transcript_77033/g.198366  ORF Transcript_77033/g.198366 Transcript_77033/m.198366 type:complete len:222 (-) Transcript_77033:235-900(-)